MINDLNKQQLFVTLTIVQVYQMDIIFEEWQQ